MSDILQLFKERDDAFKKATDELIALMPNVTTGIVQALHLENEHINKRLIWEAATLISSNDPNVDEKFVLLVGMIKHSIGDQIVLPSGQQVEVDKDNAEYFQRVLHIGVSMSLVQEGSVEDVVTFINNTIDEEQNEDEPQTPTDLADGADFDLDGLTEEQKLAFHLFDKVTGNKP